jgi:multidrug efflux pump subunit AcrA (membrane-fusion protein)
VGDSAEVWLEGASDPLIGTVTEVFQGVDVATRAFMVQVGLPADLSELADVHPRPGMFVRVEFTVGQTESLLIPASAVTERGQLEMVHVVEEGRARLRLVTLGRPRGDRVEVLSGLSDGDVVVSEASDSLREGVRVVTQ